MKNKTSSSASLLKCLWEWEQGHFDEPWQKWLQKWIIVPILFVGVVVVPFCPWLPVWLKVVVEIVVICSFLPAFLLPRSTKEKAYSWFENLPLFLFTLILIGSFLAMSMQESYAVATATQAIVVAEPQNPADFGTSYMFNPTIDAPVLGSSILIDNGTSLVKQTLTAASAADVLSLSTNSGKIYATMKDGNVYQVQNLGLKVASFFTNSVSGVVYAVTPDGSKFPVQDLGICAAIILVIIIIIIVTVVITMIADCANKKLNTTNAPPGDESSGGWDGGPITFTHFTDAPEVALLPPAGINVTLVNLSSNNIERSDISPQAGWTDWQGVRIMSEVRMTMTATNLSAGNGTFSYMQSSTNLHDWEPEDKNYMYTWVSFGKDSSGVVRSNVTIVVSDMNDVPFKMYRCSYNLTDGTAASVTHSGDFPRRGPKRWFRNEYK